MSIDNASFGFNDNLRGREAPDVSFLYLHSVMDGAVIATDSRLSYVFNGKIEHFTDNARKLFVIPDTGIVVGITGDLEPSARRIPFSNIISRIKSHSRYEAACELREELRVYVPTCKTHIVFAEVVQDSKTSLISTAITTLHHDGTSPEKWLITDELIDCEGSYYSGIGWAIGYLKNAERRMCCIDVDHVIPKVSALVQEIIDVTMQLSYTEKTVGGPVQLAVLRPGMAELKNKI